MRKSTTININNNRAISAAGLSLDDGCVTTCFPANIPVRSGAAFSWVTNDRTNRSPADIAKRINFFKARIAARKDPANCGKCGKPRDTERRMCQRCADTQRRRVAKAKGHALIAGERYTVDKLAGMVLQMRKEMNKMQVRFKLWQKSVDYKRSLKYRTDTMRKKYLKTFSRDQAMDYLAETNHAYEDKTL